MSNTLKVPFTVSTDIPLGRRAEAFVRDAGADVVIQSGFVPESIVEEKKPLQTYQHNGDRVLIAPPIGVRFLIEDGCRITYDRAPGVADREVLLFLLGSAWGALVYQRDLLPLHASGVIEGDAVTGFTGHSGAGKSTLSAQLAARGYPFFTDDVLIVDPSSLGDKAICFTGQKDLKLWENSFEFAGAERTGPVRDAEGFEKFYADPASQTDQSVGSLRRLYLLTEPKGSAVSDPISISPLKGGQAVLQMSAAVYRPNFAMDIVGRPKLYQWLGKLVQHVEVFDFKRPKEAAMFSDATDYLEEHMKSPTQAAA